MLLAVICGATSYAKVEMFGKSKQAWLKTFLELENGIPDACTFRNVIKEIDTQKLHELFCTDTCFVCRTNQAAIEPAGCLMAWDRLPPDVIDG